MSDGNPLSDCLCVFNRKLETLTGKKVGGIFNLLVKFVGSELAELNENNVKVHILGDYTQVPDSAVKSIEKALQTTRDNDGLQFNIALNYGSRAEIVRAVRKICTKVSEGQVKPGDVDENMIGNYLYTGEENGNIPDPDLIIRTSGEERAVELSALAGGI